ncbi:uncharacterized protein LOC113239985 [Hyposmocoma kahamanoa]|uniref:uncharacterized protein LOC113239985 n=1 Tax=Hyposmocoma kahamanoa TaxID=1477025 RepID=UPI000E6D76BA|nr:uncharacterized protein LOC113239985 [Hyposmocoma kahamanoa]
MKIECFIVFAFIPWYGAQESGSLNYKFYPELNGWLKLHTAIKAFDGAKKTCENEDAILGSPTGLDLLEKMKDLTRDGFNVPTSIYTGIKTYNGAYFSIDRKPIGKSAAKWGKGEPNYDRIEGKDICLLLQPDGTLATENCDSTRPFVCYKKVEKPEDEQCGPTAIDKEYRLDKQTRRCYKFVPEVKSWNDSVWNCLEEEAYPSTVYTVEKALAIKEIYTKKMLQEKTKEKTNVHFIGFRYYEDVEAWLTVFGQSIPEAAFWSNEQPIPFKDEKPINEQIACGAIDVTSDKPELSVVSCEEKYPSICEKPAPDEESVED